MPAYDGAVLLVQREVSQLAVDFPGVSRAAAAEYLTYDSLKRSIQISFASIFVLIALIALLSAVWFGLNFANRFVAPIRPADQRGRPGRFGQFLRPGPGPEERRRPRPSRRELQQDDPGAAAPARWADGGQRTHRPAPPVHRSGACRRLARRHRRGRGRPRHHRQPLHRTYIGAQGGRDHRQAAGPGRARASGHPSRGRGGPPARPPATDPADPRRARSARSPCASPASRPRAAPAASW